MIRSELVIEKVSARSLRFWIVSFCVAALVGVGLLFFLTYRQVQSSAQEHEQPGFVHVWLEGVRFGPNLTLSTGDPLTQWLTRHHLPWFHKSRTYVSRYQGTVGSLELWLGYHSELANHPELVCHRVGRTAFVDNFGQAYHGFLDIFPHSIGIYLPGYDHAARELVCTLRWMPAPPDPPLPLSEPMRFYIRLPHYPRKLPLLSQVPNGPVSQTKQGVRVTLSGVWLSTPQYSNPDASRNILLFHLKIAGGELAASNVLTTDIADPFSIHRVASSWAPAHNPLTITDPYGFPLLSPVRNILPVFSLSAAGEPLHTPEGEVWQAPVDGAGRSTDVVRFHFDVHPHGGTTLIPFDLTVRVHHDASV